MKIKTLQLQKVETRQSSTRLLKKIVFATMTLLFSGIQATYAEVGDIFSSRTVENVPMKFCVTDEENKECAVYGESIGSLQYKTAISNTTEGAITIPATARDYKVTSISEGAFFQCRNITSVSIPEGITSIGEYAFGTCMGLTTVNIPSTIKKIDSGFTACNSLERVDITDLTAWLKIDFDYYGNPLCDNYFSNKRATLYVNDKPVYDLVIPEGVTEIKRYAFKGYGKLASVTIPSSVQTIKTSAFDGCNFKLKVESTTPPELQYDGNSLLRNSALVIVPEGTKDIYRNAEGWRDLAFIVDKDVTGCAIRFISEHGTLKVTCSDGEPYDDFFIVKPGSNITVEVTSEKGYTPTVFEDNQTQGTFYGRVANQVIYINYRLDDATNVWNGQEMKLDALVHSGLGTTWIDGTFESCNGFHNDGNLRVSPYNKKQLFAVYDQEPHFGTVANGIQLIDLEAQTVKTILPASMFSGRRLRTIDFCKDPFAYDAQGTLQGRAPENWENNATAEQLRWRDHIIIACDNNANGTYNSDVVYMVSRDGNGEFSNNSPVKVIAAHNNCNSAVIHPVNGDLYFTSYEGIVFRLDMQKYWDCVYSGEEWNPKASENDYSTRPGFEIVYRTSYYKEMQIYFHPSGKYAYLVTVNNNSIYKVYYANDDDTSWTEEYMSIGGSTLEDTQDGNYARVNRPYQGCFVRNPAYAELGLDDEYDFFFADSQNNAIRYLRPDGNLYTALGATEENTNAHNTMTIKGDAYTFNRPTGLIYDEQEEVFYVIDTNNGALLKLSKSDTTGIDQAPCQLSREEMSQDTSVYDMQGRKISDNYSTFFSHSSSKKGIYIVNGRKVIVK